MCALAIQAFDQHIGGLQPGRRPRATPLRAAPIQGLQQHRQLRRRDLVGALRRRGPLEPALLQPRSENRQAPWPSCQMASIRSPRRRSPPECLAERFMALKPTGERRLQQNGNEE